MSATPTRQPAGVPTGGQFAAKSNPECDVDLAEMNTTVEHRYRPDGSVQDESHYQAGKLQDPADGAPAYRRYYPDGSVQDESYYRAGKLQDPADGTPADRWYATDGSVAYQAHYQDDARQEVAPS
jgi:antitoxin component YwqK of YwqJK toxin-antitoxin module